MSYVIFGQNQRSAPKKMFAAKLPPHSNGYMSASKTAFALAFKEILNADAERQKLCQYPEEGI